MQSDNLNNETAIATKMQSELEERSVDEVTAQIEKIQRLMESVLKPDEHYGVIPGTKKKSLYKSGAEKICFTFRLLPKFEIIKTDLGNGHREYAVTCNIYHSNGAWCGQGVGSCSTMESKYRWRKTERLCPDCGAAAIKKSNYPDKDTGKKGWYCNKNMDGCGAQFQAGDPEIEKQEVGKKENPDIADQYNTCLKMAKKRSHVDGTITATAASDIFSQDVDEPEHAKQIKTLWDKAAERAEKIGIGRDEIMRKVLDALGLKQSKEITDDLMDAATRLIAHITVESKMQARVEEEANQDVIDLSPEDETPEPQKQPEEGTAQEVVEPVDEKEDSPSSPSARFTDFVEEHGLNPTKARKIAASIRKLKDVRNLGNEDFEAILNDANAFLACYRQQYGGDQAKLDGPGF